MRNGKSFKLIKKKKSVFLDNHAFIFTFNVILDLLLIDMIKMIEKGVIF